MQVSSLQYQGHQAQLGQKHQNHVAFGEIDQAYIGVKAILTYMKLGVGSGLGISNQT